VRTCRNSTTTTTNGDSDWSTRSASTCDDDEFRRRAGQPAACFRCHGDGGDGVSSCSSCCCDRLGSGGVSVRAMRAAQRRRRPLASKRGG
jgi:hypothetical protein